MSTELLFPFRNNRSSPSVLQVMFSPTYQVMGSKDSLVKVTRITRLAAVLGKQGIPHREHIVEDADHAFDMAAPSGGDIY